MVWMLHASFSSHAEAGGGAPAKKYITPLSMDNFPLMVTFLLCPVSMGTNDNIFQVAEELRGEGLAMHGHKAFPLMLPSIPEAAAKSN